jgi:hypothetical protein
MSTTTLYETYTRPERVTGQSIAKAHWSPRKRARLAAKWRSGLIDVKATTKLAAEVFGVSLPLVLEEIAKVNGAKLAAPESLAEQFSRATPAEWLECARVVGPAVVWDRMIAPLV